MVAELHTIEKWYSLINCSGINKKGFQTCSYRMDGTGQLPDGLAIYFDSNIISNTVRLVEVMEAHRNLFLDNHVLGLIYFYRVFNVSLASLITYTLKINVEWNYNIKVKGEKLCIPLLHKGQRDML